MNDIWNPALETMSADELQAYQLEEFRDQLEYAKENSPFYAEKLSGYSADDVVSLEDVRELPTTTKAELRDAQQQSDGLYGDLLATDSESVIAYHQTSGTTGHPIRQSDSLDDWEWWTDCWSAVLWAQGVRPDDRVFFPFSYGVFIAFWAAHSAAERIGAEVVPGGGMSSIQRIQKITDVEPTVVAATPTYAFRLAEVAEQEGVDLAESTVETLICAGEPGASVPSTKAELETLWGADVHDHAGATEAGAWGFSCRSEGLGLHFNEARFLIEVLDDADEPVDPGEVGRIVITPLHRHSQPYIRFELNDRVRLAEGGLCDCGRTFQLTDGGVLGREDAFKTINGTLLSPRTVEDVVHGSDLITNEFRVHIEDHPTKDLDTVRIEVEASTDTRENHEQIKTTLNKQLKLQTQLNFTVELCPPNTLTRNKLKSDRFSDSRSRRTQYTQ